MASALRMTPEVVAALEEHQTRQIEAVQQQDLTEVALSDFFWWIWHTERLLKKHFEPGSVTVKINSHPMKKFDDLGWRVFVVQIQSTLRHGEDPAADAMRGVYHGAYVPGEGRVRFLKQQS